MPQKAKRSGKTGKFVLGAERYEKISAVEGITLTPAMKKRGEDAKKNKASPAEYRKSIIGAHRKA
jgi:hypothetical protein